MPIGGPSSFIETLDDFIAHWTAVNADLTPDLILAGGYELADLQSDRDDLDDLIIAQVQAENVVEGFRNPRDEMKIALKERFRQLAARIRAGNFSSVPTGQLPAQPHVGANHGIWVKACVDYAHIWSLINAATDPDLTLVGGYTVANLNSDLDALRTNFDSLTAAERNLRIAKEARDAKWAPLPGRLAQYRLLVQGMYPLGHQMINSLPDLYPAPGHTPENLVAQGEYDIETGEAVITYNASTDPDFDHYELRGKLGTEWEDTAAVLANNPDGVLEFRTTFGMTNGPGFGATFKVYVKLSTGNESGSNAVTVIVPPDVEPPVGP